MSAEPSSGYFLFLRPSAARKRDVRQVLRIADLVTFQTFVRLCAGRTGQLLNVAGLGADCGITQPTAKSWLSVLEASYVVFRLPALRTNVRKRLVKAPKLYFHDTGLLCYLLGIRTPEHLESHPLRGAVFECWVVSEILKYHLHRGATPTLHFYRDRQGHDVDLLVDRGDDRVAVDAKSGRTIAPDAFDALVRFRTSARHAPRGGTSSSTAVMRHRSGAPAICWPGPTSPHVRLDGRR